MGYVPPTAILTNSSREAIAQTGGSHFTSLPAILSARIMPQPASAPIEEGVIQVLRNVSRRPIDPTLDSDLVADLGFDSLQVLEVIAELEDRFDISIPLNDVPATRTVAQVVAEVATLLEGRSNA